MTSIPRSELLNLAPDEMLHKHMQKINVPEFIQIEVYEQKNFIPKSKKIAMCNWDVDQFENWYEQTL